MPGFTKKTAGLLIDCQFLKTLKESKTLPKNKNEFCVTIFSYEREFVQIFNSLNRIQEAQRQKNPDFCEKIEFRPTAFFNTGRMGQNSLHKRL